MTQDLKQFNFKIPAALLEQLTQLSKAKGITKTELIIQGIRQVLGLTPEKPQTGSIDSDIYQQLYKLEQRFQEAVDYQSTVDLETNKRIKTLEEIVREIQARLSILDIVDDIVGTPEQKTPDSSQDIVNDVVSGVDTEKVQVSTKPDIDDIDIDKDIDTCIDNSTEPGQLELVRVESDDKDWVEKSKIVDSVEILKTLRSEDPQGGWNNERLTRHRRFKNLKDKWHKVGNLQFKYTGESQKVPNSQKTLYLWFLYQPDQT